MHKLLLAISQPVSAQLPRDFRHALQEIITDQIPKLIQQRILLCLSEALTNLIEHAKPPATEISIHFTQESDGWQLTIFDNSDAWDCTENLDDDLLTEFSDQESGRGIALVHAQSDKIDYQPGSNDTPNQLLLFWALPKVQIKQTVLIVEDNNSLLLLYKAYLIKNYHVVTALNGYQALEILSTHHIDIVLSDIRMPQMNGLSLRKKINQQSGSELIPFVFLTSQDDEMVQEQAAQLGIDDYLIKPVQKAQLINVIKRILGRSQQVYQQLTTRLDKKITDSLPATLATKAHGWRMQVASRHTGSGGGDLLLQHNFTDKTQLLLTDIMGHDDSAKFFSHAYGGYLHGLIQSMQSSQAPGYILQQLSNRALDDKLLSQVTLTCCSLQLSEAGKISIASAGHPAPLLISNDNISEIDTSGVLPGLLEDCYYESNSLTIIPGQRIALFTDGLFESAIDNTAREQLQQKITASLLSTLSLPIEQALKQVMTVFDQLTNAQPSDDTLLLLLEPIE
ncbi:response regulator [Psychromonas marina]|nr:response regulator [Psychromonas marina]